MHVPSIWFSSKEIRKSKYPIYDSYLSHVTHQKAIAVLDVGQLLRSGLLIVNNIDAVLGVHKRLVLIGLILARSPSLGLGRSTALAIR